jgi:YbgC/YbaW family acyl-CoA thioester hydrolase
MVEGVSMSAPFVARRRVEFCETDMAGIVHFSNYFRYMEFAEQAFLRARGLTVAWHENGRRVGFPRRAASCEFLKPVRFEDVLEITVAVAEVGNKSVTFSFEFSCGGDEVAKGQITAVCCREVSDGSMESISIPDEIRAKFGK